MSMHAANVQAWSRKQALLEEARINGRKPSVVTWCSSSCFVKHRARELCHDMGLLVADVDDKGKSTLMRQSQAPFGAARSVKIRQTALFYAAEAGNKRSSASSLQ